VLTIAELLPFATELFGVNTQDLLSEKRDQLLVETRIALCAVGITLGLNSHEITGPLKRHRTLYYHYRGMHPLLFDQSTSYRERAQILFVHAKNAKRIKRENALSMFSESKTKVCA
jgi:hypothetical protein